MLNSPELVIDSSGITLTWLQYFEVNTFDGVKPIPFTDTRLYSPDTVFFDHDSVPNMGSKPFLPVMHGYIEDKIALLLPMFLCLSPVDLLPSTNDEFINLIQQTYTLSLWKVLASNLAQALMQKEVKKIDTPRGAADNSRFLLYQQPGCFAYGFGYEIYQARE